MHSTSVSHPSSCTCCRCGSTRPEHLVRVVAGPADLAGADEVHEHVLVHQRHAERLRLNGTVTVSIALRLDDGVAAFSRGRGPQPAVISASALVSHARRDSVAGRSAIGRLIAFTALSYG